jgi:hypothetical protein
MDAVRSRWDGLRWIVPAAGLVVAGAFLPGAVLGDGSGSGVLDARLPFGSLPEGRLAAVIALGTAAAGALGALVPRWRRPLLALGLAGMLAVAGLTVWTTADAADRFVDARLDAVARELSDTIGLPLDAVRERLEVQRPRTVSTSLEPGLLASLAGGAIGAGALARSLTRGPEKEDPRAG